MITNDHAPDIDTTLASVNDLVDSLGPKLDQLGKLTELVAFACEARRILAGMTAEMKFFKDFEDRVANSLVAHRAWQDYPDAAGEVLQDVAFQLAACRHELSERTQCVRTLRNSRNAAHG